MHSIDHIKKNWQLAPLFYSLVATLPPWEFIGCTQCKITFYSRFCEQLPWRRRGQKVHVTLKLLYLEGTIPGESRESAMGDWEVGKTAAGVTGGIHVQKPGNGVADIF